MSKTRDNYQLTGGTVEELKRSLNFLLQRFADRMDKIEGIRGSPKMEASLNMSDNRITSLADPISAADAVSLDDLTQGIDAIVSDSVQVTGAWLFSEVTSFEASIRVYDANGELIHSFEGPT